MNLWLVRHAMPVHGPQTGPAEWELTEQGRRAAESIRGILPAGGLLVSSTELKARQTLEAAGDVVTDARFSEVRRVEQYDDDYLTARHAYVTGTDHPGWETRAAVAARFDSGVRSWSERAGLRPLVIASHGLAITTWLSAKMNIGDPGSFWAGLRFPDVLAVDLGGQVVRRAEELQ
jgi:broad specificity phosphatase PhoE